MDKLFPQPVTRNPHPRPPLILGQIWRGLSCGFENMSSVG